MEQCRFVICERERVSKGRNENVDGSCSEDSQSRAEQRELPRDLVLFISGANYALNSSRANKASKSNWIKTRNSDLVKVNCGFMPNWSNYFASSSFNSIFNPSSLVIFFEHPETGFLLCNFMLVHLANVPKLSTWEGLSDNEAVKLRLDVVSSQEPNMDVSGSSLEFKEEGSTYLSSSFGSSSSSLTLP